MPEPDFPHQPVLLDPFFRAAWTRFPDCVALDIPPGLERPERSVLTFAELAEIVDAWREVFDQHGIGPGDIVAVWCARTVVDAFAAPVAALECGAAWVSIDPSFPDGHAGRILADANPAGLVVDAATVSRARNVAPGVWVAERPLGPRSDANSNSPSAGRFPDDPALTKSPITEPQPGSKSISRHDMAWNTRSSTEPTSTKSLMTEPQPGSRSVYPNKTAPSASNTPGNQTSTKSPITEPQPGSQSGFGNELAQNKRSPDHPAYLIYTSGTTGLPKGVVIPHAGIANLIRADQTFFDLGPGDRVAQGSSHSYDSSVEEIWMAWSTGATVVVLDDAANRLGPDLAGWLRDERITVACPPPTLLRSMDPAASATLPDLRLLYVGGEALTSDVVETWAPGRLLVNGYGPTEVSVTSLRTAVEVGIPITIGVPVAGLSAWVVDSELAPVAVGVAGELVIGGPGVALGYRHNPEGTAEKFVEHPALGRIYRTGDAAVLPASGSNSRRSRRNWRRCPGCGKRRAR